MTIHSLINYVGHKSKIIEQIKPYLPEQVRGTFYDCFAGSSVAALNMPYDHIISVEKNVHLVNLYSDIVTPEFKQHIFDLIAKYNLTNSSVTPRSEYLKDPNIGECRWMGETVSNMHLDQLNKPGYNKLLLDFNAGEFKGTVKSAAYMIATIYGRNSSVETKADGTLSGSVGPLDFSKRCAVKLTEHIKRLEEGRNQFICASYQDIKPGPEDFVYLDPPYLASSYRYGGWSEADERELLAWIDRLPCPWALSNTLQSGNKKNQILMDWAVGKNIVGLDKKYRKWAGAGVDTVARTTKVNYEVLIRNSGVSE